MSHLQRSTLSLAALLLAAFGASSCNAQPLATATSYLIYQPETGQNRWKNTPEHWRVPQGTEAFNNQCRFVRLKEGDVHPSHRQNAIFELTDIQFPDDKDKGRVCFVTSMRIISAVKQGSKAHD